MDFNTHLSQNFYGICNRNLSINKGHRVAGLHLTKECKNIKNKSAYKLGRFMHSSSLPKGLVKTLPMSSGKITFLKNNSNFSR